MIKNNINSKNQGLKQGQGTCLTIIGGHGDLRFGIVCSFRFGRGPLKKPGKGTRAWKESMASGPSDPNPTAKVVPCHQT